MKTLVQLYTESASETQEVKFKNKKLIITIDKSNRFKIGILAEDQRGNPYYDVSTVLPENPLMDAVWVELGGDEEKLANMLTNSIKRTNAVTTSGYNKYVKYDVI